ncbi:MAG: HAD-IIB family hydrolase [Gammaproteobacteria bacterium]
MDGKARSIKKPIVFTDLDGTLLDHDTYSWAPAAPTLATLLARNVPVVLNSSKTLAELSALREAIGLPDPVIAENGAFIDVPPGYFSNDMPLRDPLPSRRELQSAYLEVKRRGRFNCTAFFELGLDGIMAAAGLDESSARRANERRATEPVLWKDTSERLADFQAAIEARGLRCVRGGRFVHIMGNADKASAMLDLMSAYERDSPGTSFTSIALGDGPNDAAMLAAADIAVIVQGRHGQIIDLGDHPRVVRTLQRGPEGWQDAVNELLEIDERG